MCQSYVQAMKESFMADLDDTDRLLLRLLQVDGRMPNSELAKRINVSAATCFRRTQRLVAEGYVRSIRAQVDPERVGLGAVALVGVVLDRSTPESFAAFEAAVLALPMILDCHLVAGDFDYLLKIRVRDMADFNRLHAEKLIALPGVRQARTFFVMKEVKDSAPLDF